jgi:hypothetical protein
MKSLKIKKNKTKIENINEEIGDTAKLGRASKALGGTLKNLAVSALDFSKFSVKTMLSPYTYLAVKFWQGTTPSFEEFVKHASKNLDQLEKDVKDITNDFDNNYKNMLGDIGLSEDQMNIVMFAGSPPLAVSNIISDIIKKRGVGTDSKGLKNKQNIIEKISFLCVIFITGKNPDIDSNADVLMGKVKPIITKFIKQAFNSNTESILKKLHEKPVWDIHSAGIKSELEPIFKATNFEDVMKNPVDEVSRIKNSNQVKDLNKIIDKVKKYCDENYTKRPLRNSFEKTLNLKTKIITESVMQSDDADKIAWAFAYIIFVVKTSDFMKAILQAEFGKKTSKLRGLIDQINGKKNLFAHLSSIYGAYVQVAYLVEIGNKLISEASNPSYNLGSDLQNIYSELLSKSISPLPYLKSEMTAELDKQKVNVETAVKNSDFNDTKYADIKGMLFPLSNFVNLPAFNYSVYKKGALLNNFKQLNFLLPAEEKFWEFINQQIGGADIEVLIKNLRDDLDDKNKALQNKKGVNP